MRISLPMYNVCCTKCDFFSTIGLEPPEKYQYRLNDGIEIEAYPSTGWCYACEDLQTIEEVPHYWYISSILKMIPTGDRAQSKAQPEISHAIFQSVLAWLDRRKSFPRCLKCGSEDNVLLKIGDGDSERQPVIGFRHNCGGELYLASFGSSSWYCDSAHCIYMNEEGCLIEESD